MKTPTWATAIGIIMIVFGGWGGFNDIGLIRLPQELTAVRETIKKEVEEDLSENDSTETVNSSADTTTTKSSKHELEIPLFGRQSPEDKILELSEFTKTWIVRFGYIGAVASLIYLLSGVFLLVRRTFSIKLAYAALVLSILCSGMQTAVLSSNASGDFLGITMGLSQIPGILMDIVLLAVVFASDKDAYKLENLQQ